jgi:hypothetical protein
MHSNCHDNGPIYTPVTNCVDCQPEQSPCLNGESCEEVYPAECVQYNGPDLANISVLTGDRLDAILRKLNINAGSQPVTTKNTPTITLAGNGLNSNPLQATVNLDPDPDNLLVSDAGGLLFKWTVENVTTLLTLIKTTPALSNMVCDIMDYCASQTCSVTSAMSVSME